MSTLTWTVVDEGSLTLPDQEAIAAMLGRAFPDWSHWYVGGRSWSGMQPERRVLARDGDVVVAHVGIRRMFVDVGGAELLVGCVGLVAVTPDQQGTGIGRTLMEHTAAELARMGVPFGLLGTSEDRYRFYMRNGWQLLEDTVSTFSAFTADGAGVLVTDDEGWLALPVAATMTAWPGGDVRWNGQLV